MTRNLKRLGLIFIGFGLLLLNWQCLKSNKAGIPMDVVKVIAKADLNKPELMNAIGEYLAPEDSLKLKAMYWLIANMDGNYTVYYSVQDSLGRHYTFPPENYSHYLDLKHKWDDTEKSVGNLIYHADSFSVDFKSLKAGFLIDNMNDAWQAYQSNAWAKAYDFHIFCRWILPYRCANEPVEPFRKHFLKKYGDSIREAHPTSAMAAALLINRLVNRQMDYKDTYNKSANVQDIHQLEKTGAGNFWDINVYKVKVLRSFGLAATLDYTPFLADTNFGYVWTTVILPDRSELMLEFPHRVARLRAGGRLAKVYRRSFERDSTCLYAIKDIKQTTPPFLGHYYYQDISNQIPHARVQLKYFPKQPYAYLAVFNDGEWHPVTWAISSPDKGTVFDLMGTNVVYLPVGLNKKFLLSLQSPFILDGEGNQFRLKANFTREVSARITYTAPRQLMNLNQKYSLFVWNGNWYPLYNLDGNPRGYDLKVPDNGLFLLTNEDIDFSERIFVIDADGNQMFY
jgi:hypothetical protein